MEQINTDYYAFFITISLKQIGVTQSFQGSFVVHESKFQQFSLLVILIYNSPEVFYLM